MDGYELSQRRSRVSKDSDDMDVYVSIRGSIPLSDLIVQLAERHVDLAEATITFATVHWVEPATEEETAARYAHRERARERREQWERDTYARLREKYEPDDAEPNP